MRYPTIELFQKILWWRGSKRKILLEQRS